jgi:NitT/TauT family transport system substrate-binding protein
MHEKAREVMHGRALRRRWKAVGAAVAIVAAAGALSACGGSDSPSGKAGHSGSATELSTVKIGVFPGVFFSLMANVAKDQGIFEKNGIKPQFISISGGPNIVAALQSGSIAFGENSYDNLLLTRQTGLKVKALVGNVSQMPFSVVVRDGVPTPHAGQPYPAPIKDLAGLKLGVPQLKTSVQFFFESMLKDAGIGSGDVTFVAVPPPTAIAALKAKQIDAYLGFEPIQSIATSSGAGKVVLDLRTGAGPADFRDVPYNGWWVTDAYAADHPDQVKAFRQAMIDADKFIHDPANLPKVVETAKQVLPVKPLTDEQFQELVKKNLPTLGSGIPESTIPAWNDLLVKSKLLQKPIPASDVLTPDVPTTSATGSGQ